MERCIKRAAAVVLCALAPAGLTACGKTVSTSAFKGEQHEVAQAISNLQSDVTAGDEQKICSDDLAQALVARLDTTRGGCRQAIKDQLAEIDSDELAVDSVQLAPGTAPRSATARVRSIFSGKTVRSTLALAREGGKWKVAALG